MKKRYGIRILTLVLILSCLLANFSVFTGAEGVNEDEIDSCCNFESVGETIHFGANEYHFMPGETIHLTYYVETVYNIVDIVGEAIGFNIISIGENAINEKQVDITLTAVSSVEECELNFEVVLSNETSIFSTLYGLNNQYGTFISYLGNGDALKKYLEYMLQTERMTAEQCQAAYNQFNATYIESTYEILPFVEPELSESDNQASLLSNTEYYGDTHLRVALRWKDQGDSVHYLSGVKVCVYDFDGSSSQLLATVYTNYMGVANYYFNNPDAPSDGENGGYDLKIVVYAGDQGCTVVNGDNQPHMYAHNEILGNVATGVTHSLGVTLDMDADAYRPFEISQAIWAAKSFALDVSNRSFLPVTVQYPYSPNAAQYQNLYDDEWQEKWQDDLKSFYRRSEKKIYIYEAAGTISSNDPLYVPSVNNDGLSSFESWDMIMHEYGHHIQNVLGLSGNPGGAHIITHNLAVDLKDKSIGCALAWFEGWADAFAIIAPHYIEDNYRDGMLRNIKYKPGQTENYVVNANYESYNFNRSVSFEHPEEALGEACELNVAAVLWDMYDGTNDESLCIDAESWWSLATTADVNSLSDFVNAFSENYSSWEIRCKFGEILTQNNIAPSIDLQISHNADNLGATPYIVWKPGNNGKITIDAGIFNFENDTFSVVFLNDNYEEIFIKDRGHYQNIRLSQGEWELIQDSCVDKYYVCVLAKDTAVSTFVTGYYYSAPIMYEIPQE
ncbi:MAG: hypothetical protein IKD45_02175 [Clostridia bacterium]|nr:hypothetical protein [Clostridia bacterium]